MTTLPSDGALAGYQSEEVTVAGKTRTVLRVGSGPAVLVIHEVPGVTPLVAAFGKAVAERGMTAVLPVLFGTVGASPSGLGIAKAAAFACISREFNLLATNRTSPITIWLRALAAHEHARCGGPGVGAVGMCLTGGFALAMMVDPIMVAPVLSQPALPAGINAARRRDIGLSPVDLDTVKKRTQEGACAIGLRFTGDSSVPAERFARLRQELGDGFIGIEIDSSEDNTWGYRKGAHSVLTQDYNNAEGSPTREAFDQVMTFFSQRLHVNGPS